MISKGLSDTKLVGDTVFGGKNQKITKCFATVKRNESGGNELI